MSLSEVRKQIIESSDQIESATGERPTLFRPPYGAMNDAVKKSNPGTENTYYFMVCGFAGLEKPERPSRK
ncbi:polysaccharide deacetylase family protein [Paenibacillus sp. DMB20]|uniref:polysaccharide deacetylase family protein n=1 Tax=Paenibacillus sp. DMB20 TaxID=1642570 RepID=UPI003FA5EC50